MFPCEPTRSRAVCSAADCDVPQAENFQSDDSTKPTGAAAGASGNIGPINREPRVQSENLHRHQPRFEKEISVLPEVNEISRLPGLGICWQPGNIYRIGRTANEKSCLSQLDLHGRELARYGSW